MARILVTMLMLCVLLLSLSGRDVQQEKNGPELVKELTGKAEEGDAEAEYRLGDCYLRGVGVIQNLTQALRWWRKAAEQDYAQAQFMLGSCYRFGHGVAEDDFEAVKWLRKAAEQGNADAQNGLGACY